MKNMSRCEVFRKNPLPVINPSLTTLSPFLRAGNRAEFIERAKMARQAGASTLHLDIFDPNYVDTGGKPSNMDIFCPDLAGELKREVGLPVDAHFMVRPSTLGGHQLFNSYLRSFEGSADFMSIHLGAFIQDRLFFDNIWETLSQMKATGASAGIVINPNEGPFLAGEIGSAADFALAMTVIPGDGGRGFDMRGLCNISRLRALGFPNLVAADGAITGETINAPFNAGARWFVVGSYWFGSEKSGYKTQEQMRQAYDAMIDACKPRS